MNILGEHMRRYRSQNKMTCAQLVEKINCSSSLISYIENGWVEKCSLRKFCEIVKMLQLSPEEVYKSAMDIAGDINGECNS